MAQVFIIRDLLVHGDSRAAVVLSVNPLLVASYCDDMDGVCLLQFPSEFADDYKLQKGSRLLTVLSSWVGGSLAPDVWQGEAARLSHTNFHPYIGEFLSDDMSRIAERKDEIDETEWERAWHLGMAYLGRFGAAARDGRPTRSGTPAQFPPFRVATARDDDF